MAVGAPAAGCWRCSSRSSLGGAVRRAAAVWSGHPNPQLVAEAAGLAPGRALDIGSRRGRRRDLAGRARLAGHRARLLPGRPATGPRSTPPPSAPTSPAAPTGARPTCAAGRRRTATSGVRPGDVALLPPARPGHARRWCRGWPTAVAPGGTLLVVGHHPDDLATGHRWGAVDMMYTAADLVAAARPRGVGRRGRRGPAPRGPRPRRRARGPARGRPRAATRAGRRGVVTVRDAVLRARRR